MPNAAIIGHTGFVGGELARAMPFDGRFNSVNIHELAGSTFDLVICAGAPAVMWSANSNPEQDRRNLERLAQALLSAKIGRLVLISTVAVFDDLSRGYTESQAVYETQKPYGRNRRDLEIALSERPGQTQIVRLPALFGRGLRKNFIFDLMNPVPSFLKPEKWKKLKDSLGETDVKLLEEYFEYDNALSMLRFDRDRARRNEVDRSIATAFSKSGFTARDFTNSSSEFQYYNLARLPRDIETIIRQNIDVINICSEPIAAREVHEFLTGTPFDNSEPPLVKENVLTQFSGVFGGGGAYHFDRKETLRDLRKFYEEGRPW